MSATFHSGWIWLKVSKESGTCQLSTSGVAEECGRLAQLEQRCLLTWSSADERQVVKVMLAS
jgi:hypothetical protein